MSNKEFIESISLDGEIWKDVVGYEGLYIVSNMGRIVSLSRHLRNRYSSRQTAPKILSPYVREVSQNYRFYCVSLWKNNKSKSCRVHQVVATAFIPNPHNLPEIDHIDTDTANNSISNLRRCTRLENANNPITKAKNREIRLGKPMPKLRKPIVQLLNGEVVNTFPSIKSTVEFGFSKTQISMCCHNQNLSHKGFKWMFLRDYETQASMSKNS